MHSSTHPQRRFISSTFTFSQRHVTSSSLFLAATFTIAVLLLPPTAHAFSYQCSDECDRERDCPSPPTNCPTVLDTCDCCLECARLEGQSCQGPFGQFGRCAEDLVCMTQPRPGELISRHDEGICMPNGQPPAPDDCDRTLCDVVFEPVCPPDSKSVKGAPVDGQCCPDPPMCQCLDCVRPDLVCPQGQLKVKAMEGQGTPGECCDVFECQPHDEVCGDLVCPEERLANLSCPADSVELPPMLTHNGCCSQQRCECLHVFECAPVVCNVTEKPEQVHRATGLPGDCCDVWQCRNITTTCEYMGKKYADGESWMIDPCTRGTCKQGIRVMADLSSQCETPSNCGLMYKPEGKCCLECKGCVDENSLVYDNKETWRPDECRTCICDEGQISCQIEDCFFKQCEFPTKVPGQCCPVCPKNETRVLPPHCPSLRMCTLYCVLGNIEDQYGCPTCQCKSAGVIAPECDKLCPLGFQVDEEGNSLCECIPPEDQCPRLSNCTKLNCIYGYRRDEHGCPKCKCRKCAQLHCGKKCPLGYEYNEHGCKICRCIGPEHNSTVIFPTTPVSPTALVPTRPTDGRACLSTDGHMMEDGQSWHDGCRRCFCYAGREMCASMTCPVVSCRYPFIKMGDCCPSCGAMEIFPLQTTSCSTQDGRVLREGDTWMLDKCTTCICHDGGMLCDKEPCPPILCHHPYYLNKDSCCAVCPDDSSLTPLGLPDNNNPPAPCVSKSGYVYAHGDTWKVSTCQSCVCRNGQTMCFSQTCPILQCERTTLVKGHCCPACLEPTTHIRAHCLHNGEAYAEGEQWTIDACSTCVCYEGQKMCTETLCDAPKEGPECPHIITLPGTCCPICTVTTEVAFAEKVTASPGEPVDHSHHTYHIIIAILVLIILVVIVIPIIYVCRKRRHHYIARSCEQNNITISHFTQTNSEYKKRPKSLNNGDLKNIEAYNSEKLPLQGITNTQMNEYTTMPGGGVHNSGTLLNNEYSTIPARPTAHNEYATLNHGMNLQIDEYTPLTGDGSTSGSQTDSQTDCQTASQANSQTPIVNEKMWRYSSAEDKAHRGIYSDMPDICDMAAGSRKSL